MTGSAPSIRERVGEALFLSLLSLVVGVLGGFLALFVRLLIHLFTSIFFYGTIDTTFRSPSGSVESLGILVLFVPAFAFVLSVGLVRITTRSRRVRGTEDVVEASLFHSGKLDAGATSIHAVATCLSLGGGASAGREGAIVQLSSSVGSAMGELFSLSFLHRRILLACGAASAMSATFNTPIAGLVFAIEVVLLELRVRSFVPLGIASVVGGVTGRALLGDQPSFPVPSYRLVSPLELPIYALLGLLSGALGALFLYLPRRFEERIDSKDLPFWIRTSTLGMGVGLLGFLFPASLGVGYETVERALSGSLGIRTLAFLLGAKILAYALTRTSNAATGAISPSLFAGSMLGGLVGTIVHRTLPDVSGPPGAYALVGMAAFFGATSQAPLTSIVLLFEMTRNYDIILPIMLASVVAHFVSRALYPHPLYAPRRTEGEEPLDLEIGVNVLDVTRVQEVMSSPVMTVRKNDTIREVLDRTFRTGHQGFPVLDERGRLVGIITATDLRKKVGPHDLDQSVAKFMTKDVVVTYPDEILHTALTKMVQRGVGHLPVVRRDDPTWVVGFLTRSDILDVERRVVAEKETPLEKKVRRWGG